MGARYGYTVSYAGVGDPPLEFAHLGHCTQIALFVRSDNRKIMQRFTRASKARNRYEQVIKSWGSIYMTFDKFLHDFREILCDLRDSLCVTRVVSDIKHRKRCLLP